jgi:hypothetical protein
MPRLKAKIGDICEIKTPAGLAYVQYTHDGRDMGDLVRVLPGLFNTRPTEFAELARQKELYFIFYRLNYALRNRQAEVVSHQPVPSWAQPYPLMRWTLDHRIWKIFKASDPLTLEDHKRTPVIQTLTPQQKRLSVHLLRPHPVMVRELARGWTPEREEELRSQDAAEAAEKRKEQPSHGEESDQPTRHFLYFATKSNAEKAGKQLRDRGFLVEVRKGAGGEDWLALATKAPPNTGDEMEELRDEMEALAQEFGGEYDGWEAAVDSSTPQSNESVN